LCALLSLQVICYDRDTRTNSVQMEAGENGNNRMEWE